MSGRGWIWGWGRKGSLAKMKEAEGREKQPTSCRKPDLEGSVFTALMKSEPAHSPAIL